MTLPLRRSLLMALVALAIFAVCGWLSSLPPLSTIGHQVFLKLLLLAASLVAMALWTPAGADWGLRRATGVRWSRVLGPGLALGALASIVVLTSGGKGLQAALGPMKFWQMVLVIWLWSSLTEEVFTRAWLQGSVQAWRHVKVVGPPLPAVLSGLVFGAMHVSLFVKGVDAITASVIVLAATTLGLYAGVLRERFNSIQPAVAVHVAFNVGGAFGGALYVIAWRITTGHFPSHLGVS